MEMFTLFGARVCSMGRERWTKWTQSKFIFIRTAGVMAKRITVIMQQLRSCVRARQTTTALGEEPALRGHPRWAMRGGVTEISIQGETAFNKEGLLRWVDQKAYAWRIMKRELAASNRRSARCLWVYDSS